MSIHDLEAARWLRTIEQRAGVVSGWAGRVRDRLRAGDVKLGDSWRALTVAELLGAEDLPLVAVAVERLQVSSTDRSASEGRAGRRFGAPASADSVESNFTSDERKLLGRAASRYESSPRALIHSSGDDGIRLGTRRTPADRRELGRDRRRARARGRVVLLDA